VKITTRATFDFEGNLIEWEGFDYDGPVAECKKGRENLQKAADAGNANTTQAQGVAKQGQDIANSEINTSGGLSPLVAKQLANEQGMIGKTYSSAAQAANKGLAMRGMGAAPTGMQSSINNTAINNAGMAQTGAVGRAFGTQNELNNNALKIPLEAINTANGSVNAATGAGQAVNQAGSTLGDIGQGLSGLASIGGSVFGAGGAFGKGGRFGKP
jgi:hypothetical protein